MKRLLAAALLLLTLSGSAPEGGGPKAAGAPCRILAAADPHVLAPSLTDGGDLFRRTVEAGDGKEVLRSMELIDALIGRALAERPDALILCGDLTLNGARESHVLLAGKLRALREAGVAVLVIPGNHDLNCLYAGRYRGDTFSPVPGVTADEFRSLYASCGYDGALARDAQSLSYVYPLTGNLRVLMLDVNAAPKPGTVGEGTLAWARAQLARAQDDGAAVVAVSHQNLLAHTEPLTAGWRMGGGEALARLYAAYGVRLNLSGHLHIQHIARGGGIVDAATGALSMPPHLCAAVEWDGAGRLTYEARPLDLAAWAASRGTLPPLSAEDTRAFFERTTRAKALDALGGIDLTPAEREAMADFAARVNTGYFAGSPDVYALARDPARLLWREKAGEIFWSGYLEAILTEPQADHRRAAVEIGPDTLRFRSPAPAASR